MPNIYQQPFPQHPVKLKSRRGFSTPALRAAITLLIPKFFLYYINSRIISLSLYLFYPIYTCIYIICGYLAAGFYKKMIDEHGRFINPNNMIKAGAAAGLTLCVISWIILLILVFGFHIQLFSALWIASYGITFCFPVEFLLSLFLGAAGAKIYLSRM